MRTYRERMCFLQLSAITFDMAHDKNPLSPSQLATLCEELHDIPKSDPRLGWGAIPSWSQELFGLGYRLVLGDNNWIDMDALGRPATHFFFRLGFGQPIQCLYLGDEEVIAALRQHKLIADQDQPDSDEIVATVSALLSYSEEERAEAAYTALRGTP